VKEKTFFLAKHESYKQWVKKNARTFLEDKLYHSMQKRVVSIFTVRLSGDHLRGATGI
jgi:hypothetical protein